MSPQFRPSAVLAEQRRRDVERIRDMKGGVYKVRGQIGFSGTGETITAVSFPVPFTEEPFFASGMQISSASHVQSGSYPSYHAFITSWNFIIKPDTGLKLYIGASIAITCSGAVGQQVTIDYQFEGKALRNPTTAIAPTTVPRLTGYLAGGTNFDFPFISGGDPLSNFGTKELQHSTNLVIWDTIAIPVVMEILCMAKSDTTCIIGGFSNGTPSLLRSTDLRHWEGISSDLNGPFYPNPTYSSDPHSYNFVICIAYGNGVWLATGVGGTVEDRPNRNSSLRSTDDGKTFTQILGFTDFIYDAVYHDGLWVASNGSQIITSNDDALTWSVAYTAPQSFPRFKKIVHANGYFVAVGAFSSDFFGDANLMATSPDGITWTDRSSSFVQPSGSFTEDFELRYVAYGNGVWVTCGAHYRYFTDAVDGDDRAVFTSTDLDTWTPHSTPMEGFGTFFPAGSFEATYGPLIFDDSSEQFLLWVRNPQLVFEGQEKLLVSSDGATWGVLPSPHSLGATDSLLVIGNFGA